MVVAISDASWPQCKRLGHRPKQRIDARNEFSCFRSGLLNSLVRSRYGIVVHLLGLPYELKLSGISGFCVQKAEA